MNEKCAGSCQILCYSFWSQQQRRQPVRILAFLHIRHSRYHDALRESFLLGEAAYHNVKTSTPSSLDAHSGSIASSDDVLQHSALHYLHAVLNPARHLKDPVLIQYPSVFQRYRQCLAAFD